MLLRSPVPIVMLWGEDGVMLYNDAYSVFAGGRHPTLLGSKVREGWPEVARFNDHVMKVGLAGGTLSYKDQRLTLYRHGIPEQVWMNLDYSPVLDETGTPAGVLAIVVETTGRVAAERRIRDTNERFRAFLTASANSMYRMSPDWKELRQLEGGTFLSDTTTASTDWLATYIHPQDQTHVMAAVEEAVRTRTTFDLEHRVKFADGTLGWTHSRAVPVMDERGAVIEWFGAASDVTPRKQAEEDLRASEARYRQIVEGAEDFAILTLDAYGRITSMNSGAARITGYTTDEATGQAGAILFTPEDRAAGAPADELKRADRSGRALNERWHVKKDGVRFWGSGLTMRLDTAAGGYLKIFRDRTAEYEAEAAVRRLNETLEAQVAARTAERDRIWSLPRDLMCVARSDGMLLSVNPAWERMLGWRAEELMGREAAEIKHPDDAARTAAEFARLAAGHPTFGFEERLRHKDGSWCWISWTIEPEGDLLYCVGRDVTAEKHAREALEAAETARREADALYRAYFENTPEALFVIGVTEDDGFVVEQVNPAHEAAVGFKLDDIRGKRVEDILPRRAAEWVLEKYRHVVRTGEILQYREVSDLSGDLQHWDTSLVPIRDVNGRIVRLIGSSRNMTRQMMAEEALRQSQKMEAMGQLTGGVAHDFNNLLTPIFGSLDILQRKGIGGEREQRLIAGAMQSAERAKTLVQRLLAFARRQPLQPVAVDVAQLVAGMCALVESTTGPQITVVMESTEGLPAAKADPNQLEMALLNLSVNARDAMPQGGTLRISATAEQIGPGHRAKVRAGRYVCISVADTGTGMDEATLGRATEPFFSTKGIGKGTGLGLSMVHGLASQLGGALTIQSRSGVGTNVELWLPVSVAPAEAAKDSPATISAAPGRGLALLVDDEEVVRMTTADLLSDLGYKVVEAGSAEDALRLVRAGLRPDVLITDHLMPGMTGTELAKVLRVERPETRILIVSGYAETDGISTDFARLTKPFRNDELLASLSALAEKPS